MTMKDPSHGRGPFVRRSEMSGLVAEVLKGRSSAPAGNRPDRDGCLVKNLTSVAHEPFSVLQIGDSLILPGDNESVYRYQQALFEASGIAVDGEQRVCVLQEPLNVGNSLSRARFSGITRCRITGKSGKSHARTISGETALEAADDGEFTIVFDPGSGDEEDEEAERIAIVRFGNIGTAITHAEVTTPNCCVDQYNLNYGALVDGVLNYVEATVIDPVTGSDESVAIDVYPAKSLHGFLCCGGRIEVMVSGGKYIAIGTAQLDADAVITVTAGPSLAGTATLFPDDPEDGTRAVNGVTVNAKCDTVDVDTAVRVKWQIDPVANTSSLVIEDACCEPGEPEPFGDAE